ncbi:hypothetical protein SCHPADRAFT_843111 [Schizopora paradoxa]|uniref:Phosphomethylpyrimidine kinase n=1 Tax=Schizopora paradoxa TaxID=27342 RepID=A0A0H2SD11_9AGAM|nr:hypothetical protein SCHPADRAFT_843111 [Schizopora paradoxa]
MTTSTPPIVSTIAGSDSSGGAGIQADLKTFAALNCYGTSIITALTAQNTTGVQDVSPVSPEFVKKQIESVLSDIQVSVFKTGMLHDAAVIHEVASTLKSFYNSRNDTVPPLIVDPVCVSTSGHTLLQEDAVQTLIDELFPLATLITPNKAEADLLLSKARGHDRYKISTIIDSQAVAMDLGRSFGSTNVLIKGGHISATVRELERFKELIVKGNFQKRINVEWDAIPGQNMEILRRNEIDLDDELVVDVLYEAQSNLTTLFARPRIHTTSTHGTGCTLSAAIACYIAQGFTMLESVRLAIAYTQTGIENAFPLGHGHGPLNHLHSVQQRQVPLPTSSNPYPFTKALIASHADLWKEYVEHSFVRQVGEGTLREECFVHFIKQDYHYLKYYARAYGLLVAKSHSFDAIQTATQTILNILNEVKMHKSFCEEWGISNEQLETAPESPATMAYGSYLLNVGLQGDGAKLLVALAACLLGYGEVGLWLISEASKGKDAWVKMEGNKYRKWIEDYGGESYQSAVKTGIDILETIAREDPPSQKRFDEWKEVWGMCTKLERNFWDMALELS